MYKLSLFCRASYIFNQELNKKGIEKDKIVNYAFQLILNKNIEDDPIIEDIINKNYLKGGSASPNEKFYFQESPILMSFMAKLYAFSMINLHICIIGETGIGKTSCAREFGKIRAKNLGLPKHLELYMHSFHSNTKSNHFYGSMTMKNGEIEFINGPLLNAMENGTTFIADEMNLSPEIIMKSLVPVLDLNLNNKIYIPGIQKKIKIQQNFFFIACQNDFTTTGRNSLPKLLAKKLKCINYPHPPINEIEKICSHINSDLYTTNARNELKKQGEKIAKYMNKLNSLKLSYIPNWSIRDIIKVLKRVKHQTIDINACYYSNISFVDNIVFYTLSGIYKKDLKDEKIKKNLLNKILVILKEIFSLSDAEIKNIESIFKEEAKIVKEKNGNFIRKGKCGISLSTIHYFDKQKDYFDKHKDYFDKYKQFFGLPSLYDDLFQILLADKEEPILIIGESGYKTFLAKLVLNNAITIQLNAETTIGQLLGSTIVLSDSEVKLFYLKQIANILNMDINDGEEKMVQNWINYKKEEYEKMREEQTLINKKIDEQKKKYSNINKTVKNILEILEENFSKDSETNKKKLRDINLEFKPGLILEAIFSGKFLILKNISNLPTVVLERFNELFSDQHNLTLNEDVHETFTKDKKELSDLGKNFRIIATCSLGEQNKLSEAVLSRFTVVCTDKYKSEEIKDVLKSALMENGLEFDQKCIDEVIKFSKEIKNNSLSQMIKALSLSNNKEIFKESEKVSRINILSFVLYRIYYGLAYKIKSKTNNQYFEIEEKLQLYLPEFRGKLITGEDVDEEPLKAKEINGNKFIESIYNKLLIEYGTGQETEKKNMNNLVFTKTFTEMVDYIFLGIATNTPVILEGGSGLGKQTAINYVAYKLNYRIINFIITQSTKIEDLLGRNQIIRKEGHITIEFRETNILKILGGNDKVNNGDNILIVFHNLNKASSALMEALCSIFDKGQKNFLRPDGKSESKAKINVMGIINSESSIAIKDKLPTSLINCVFYYILPKLSADEIEKIISKKFSIYELTEEENDFKYYFNKSREFSYIKGNISYFSLNDIEKYILFRRFTKDFLDKSIILQMIFAYRFIQNEFILEIMNDLGFKSLKINPDFRIQKDQLSISFKNQDSKKEIIFRNYDHNTINEDEIEKKINTLNMRQKQCLLFISLSIKCKRACVIQGDTASGKSHLVRLLAEMLGQKLIVYQINKETGLSLFSGQSTLSSHLDNEEIETILNYFTTLNKYEPLREYISKYFLFDNYNSEIEKKWTAKRFNDLIHEINEFYIKNDSEMKDDYFEFKKIAFELKELIRPYKRFKKNESTFVEALEKGYWVLIDGIESANPIISDKLIRLCGENPELDLTDTGENIIFSKNPSDRQIHKNFHLFINYNPLNKSNNNQLSEMFLNKCITFTLAPMDIDTESSAQIIYGFLKNSNSKTISDLFRQEISSKAAKIHQDINKKIQKDQDFFSGGVEFTGRTIKYIGEEIYNSKDENDLIENLINALYINYINSINNKNGTKNIIELKNIIKESVKNSKNFDTGEKNIYIRYSKIFNILKNIQKVAKYIIKEYKFNFIDLLNSLREVEISDLKQVYYHIDGTLKMLDIFVGDSIKKKQKYFQYYNLEIIKNLLRNILDYVENTKYDLMNYKLNDKIELINKSLLTKEIAKFELVYKLELKMKKFNLTNSFIYLPDEIIEYINSIKQLLEKNNVENLFSHLKIVKIFYNQEINILELFPFNQILLEKEDKNIKRIRMFKMLFLIYKIIDKKINFQIGNDKEFIKFDSKKEKKRRGKQRGA